jgi:Spy/CpxP family protein refolding chaperone
MYSVFLEDKMTRTRWPSLVFLAAACCAAGTAAGCGGGNTNTTANAPASAGAPEGVPAEGQAEEEQSPEADALRAFHRHHHVGFIGFALLSIPTLGLPPQEEASAQKIRAEMQAKFRPAHDAEAALLNVVADGVAAGSIDQAKVDAAITKMADVSTQMDDATNEEINKLHAVLQPPERQALALKVQAHYEIWFKANAEEAAQPNQEMQGGHIQHLAQILGLTPDQVQKIDAAFTQSMATAFSGKDKFDGKAAEQHMNAFISAFPGDTFDAKTLTTADKANSSVAVWGARRMVRMYQAMTPILTPDQRTKLAALLREHANKLEAP